MLLISDSERDMTLSDSKAKEYKNPHGADFLSLRGWWTNMWFEGPSALAPLPLADRLLALSSPQ